MPLPALRPLVLLLSGLLVAALGACGQTAFPTAIHTTRTSQHVRVPGTRLYGVFPTGYQPYRELARYQKRCDLYVQVVEIPAGFTKARPALSREAVEAKGATVTVWQPVQVNQYPGIYMEGPSKRASETKLILTFGDDSVGVVLAGVGRSTDAAGLAELRGILQTAWYDPALRLDPLELANFSFDQRITGFRYARTVTGSFVFAEGGAAGLQQAHSGAIAVTALPAASAEEGSQLLQRVLINTERQSGPLTDKQVVTTTLNGYPAQVVTGNLTAEGVPGCFYLALVMSEKTGVVFYGTAFHDLPTYRQLFAQTAATIQLK